MCLALYLSADVDLPLVDDPILRVREAASQPEALGVSRVVSLGTSGCACGLLRDGATPDELAVRDEALRQLQVYLSEVCRDGPVRMLLCWSGDAAPPSRSSMTVAQVCDLDADAAVDAPLLVDVRVDEPGVLLP
jgi:hypothetical protein